MRIVARRAHDARTRQKNTLRFLGDSDFDALISQSTPTPLALATRNDLVERVRELMPRLPKTEGDAIRAYFDHDGDASAMARSLDIPPRRLYAYLSRARRTSARLLQHDVAE